MIPQKTVTGFTCDCCGKKVLEAEDPVEAQEAHHINFTGGYGSVFGDGAQIQADICQACLKTLIGNFARITKSPY